MKIKEILYSAKNADLVLSQAINYFESISYLDKEQAEFFLEYTTKPNFLKSLTNDNIRNEWAELTYKLIRYNNYSLRDLLNSRANELANHTLFYDMSETNPGKWTYKRISYYIKEIAASLYDIAATQLEKKDKPRVAIFCENSVVSACCDLASLSYDIFVTPLNVSFNREVIEYIIDLLGINIIISDDKNRIDTLISIKNSKKIDLAIVSTRLELNEYASNILFLGEYETKFNMKEVDNILSKREIMDVNQVCTVMFTSGSTGMPKGLSFTMYNLITKRFARAAALPEIGDDEVFLCYLPLYHTFGRYLELLGSIYWRATYVFAGNTSSDTLLQLFPKIEPSIFISIPLRWNQLYEKASELMSDVSNTNELKTIFRSLVGSRLKWGLSAAGYLDPKVFIFFSKNGVELSSGFGMTEATGGITMTPPYNYREGTVGKPLPGVTTTINDDGVLEISGHYVAYYLEDATPYSHIPYPDEKQYIISTGDVFRADSDGFYEIIDRVKDIYKNNRGQTVSPKNIENKFEGVPGIKRTFLVGDGRPYNTLFIIPDLDEEIIMSKPKEEIDDYFNLIILKANLELAPYERIVNYTILDRDFSHEKGELTPKNSYNRKNIERNFANEIDILYEKKYLDFNFENHIIRIPHWFIRDLGILESDISLNNGYLLNDINNTKLNIKKTNIENQFLIGDLIYEINSKVINLGTICRQPKLWSGNPNLINFCPIKEGWDTFFEGISENVFLPYEPISEDYNNLRQTFPSSINTTLIELNKLFCDIFFGTIEIAKDSLVQLSRFLANNAYKNIGIIRKRLESLARHPAEDIRCTAYRILLLDEPSPDYSKAFPAFIKSGLSFLNEKSIQEIASSKFEVRRLESLRKRLLSYRMMVDLKDDDNSVYQFSKIFQLLFDFLKNNYEYYTSVRYELISWMLFDNNPKISYAAAEYFKQMHVFYEKMLDETTEKFSDEIWESKLVYDDGISSKEKAIINSILVNKAFLRQSILLIFDENDFLISEVKDKSAWISKLNSGSSVMHYRIVLAMKNNRRYDVQFFINNEDNDEDVLNTILQHVSISGYPYGYRVLAKLGAYRPELSAWSFEYFGELSLWAKIRELSSQRISSSQKIKFDIIKKYYILGISAFFRGWHNSGKNILPGVISPNNVIIPELDFRESTLINSINGWKKYTNPLQFFDAIIHNFYKKTIIHYPWLESILDTKWICNACVEALGIEDGKQFLTNLSNEIQHFNNNSYLEFNTKISEFINNLESKYYIWLKISNAIERYKDWEKSTQNATREAKEQAINEIIGLYNINIKNEADRFYIYKNTYFKDSVKEIQNKFNDIVNRLYRNKDERATQLIEITELQSLIESPEDMLVFTRMLFPRGIMPEMKIEQTGTDKLSSIVIKSFIKDSSGEIYTFREAANVSEIGMLYRIFFKENYPKTVSELDEHYILTDSIDRIIGGLCYRKLDQSSVLIDGGIIISSMKNRGLGTAMLEDFCSRMASKGYEYVKAHFYLKNFYLKRGFEFDQRYGLLVRYLNINQTKLIEGNYCVI